MIEILLFRDLDELNYNLFEYRRVLYDIVGSLVLGLMIQKFIFDLLFFDF